MAKLPSKFDNISSISILGAPVPGYQTDGYAFQSKMKTNFNGLSADMTASIAQDKKDSKLHTTSKISFKSPKLFPFIPGITLDKFEFGDIDGKTGDPKSLTFEYGFTKDLHGFDGLKVDLKGNKKTQNICGTFNDTHFKVELTEFAPNFNGEVMQKLGNLGGGDAIVGFKKVGAESLPQAAVSYTAGDIFACVTAKNAFAELSGHGSYKVSGDISVAAEYFHGGKDNGKWNAAAACKLGEVDAKVKLNSDLTLFADFKKLIAQGATFHGGFSYNTAQGKSTLGAKVILE